MAVNGIEIEVGQVWRTRGGECLRVENRLGHESPLVHHGYEFLLQDQTAVSSSGRSRHTQTVTRTISLN